MGETGESEKLPLPSESYSRSHFGFQEVIGKWVGREDTLQCYARAGRAPHMGQRAVHALGYSISKSPITQLHSPMLHCKIWNLSNSNVFLQPCDPPDSGYLALFGVTINTLESLAWRCLYSGRELCTCEASKGPGSWLKRPGSGFSCHHCLLSWIFLLGTLQCTKPDQSSLQPCCPAVYWLWITAVMWQCCCFWFF